MNILIIGSGGREHAIGLALQNSQKKPNLFFAPGNAGTSTIGTNIPISDTELDSLLQYAQSQSIDLTIVGPETPLVLGITDLFLEHNLAIIGPNKEAAQLEGSKEWAKNLMKKHHIPTAAFEVFTTFENSKHYIQTRSTYPIVIKADGLAAGKGVTIAHSEHEAIQALEECFLDKKFKDAGLKVVIEDFLQGDEASIFAFTDSHTFLSMLPAQDHKAINDGDTGPNTGGMGAYCPTPLISKSLKQRIDDEIFAPLLQAFKKENIVYKGILYAGLMIAKDGTPSIVEFNARFGDPETQVVLPLLKTDLLDIFNSIHTETLEQHKLKWSSNSAVCVVLAAGGYPNNYNKGMAIQGLDYENENITLIHAGTHTKDGQTVTSGGRVLGVVSQADSLNTAIDNAYTAIPNVSFDSIYYRKDIGQKAKRYITN